MPQLSVQGARVSYTEQGSGAAIVLLHAGGSSSRQWLKTARLLEDGFRVIAPDLWGFGGTGMWSGKDPLTHDHQAMLVAAAIDQLAIGPVHLVGHSYGGAVALRLALKQPELVKKLILIEPILMRLLELAGDDRAFREYRDMANAFLSNTNEGKPGEGWRAFIDYRNGPGTWDALPAASRERFLAGTESTAAGFHSNLTNPTSLEDLRRLIPPTLVMCGEKTTPPDRKVTEILRDHIPGCRYVVIPGAEHMSPLSHADFIAQSVRTFIA
jgi:lipase